jgi:hypothetical protein
MEIDGLHIAMAHISWPWTDEMVAVYGKVNNAKEYNPGSGADLYIDLTPGTPECYRFDALNKLFSVPMDIRQNIIYGIDTCINNYSVQMARDYIDMDNKIFDKLGINFETREDIFQNSFFKFTGLSHK